jgi:hypothetical protein
MHDCPTCGQVCTCSGDFEDHDSGLEFSEDCTHKCEGTGDEDHALTDTWDL